MKRFAMMVLMFSVFSGLAFAAEDGAAIYKAKCAGCHGATGEGKVGPKLQGTSMTAAQISDALTKGVAGKKAPHAKGINGLTPEQAAAVASYVLTLK
jgi:mono/diheme cytochrome c family protein